MSAGSLIFLLLIGGSVFFMFSMHRGGHSHGGSGGGHGGMGGGGCGGGGHSHGGDPQDESAQDAPHEHGQGTKPLLGPPGTQSGTPAPAPAPAQGHRHRGC